MTLSLQAVLRVECPTCAAAVGTQCEGTPWKYIGHAARVDAAKRGAVTLRDNTGRDVALAPGDVVTTIYDRRYRGARGRVAHRYVVVSVKLDHSCGTGVLVHVRREGARRGGPTLDLDWFRGELASDYPNAVYSARGST